MRAPVVVVVASRARFFVYIRSERARERERGPPGDSSVDAAAAATCLLIRGRGDGVCDGCRVSEEKASTGSAIFSLSLSPLRVDG